MTHRDPAETMTSRPATAAELATRYRAGTRHSFKHATYETARRHGAGWVTVQRSNSTGTIQHDERGAFAMRKGQREDLGAWVTTYEGVAEPIIWGLAAVYLFPAITAQTAQPAAAATLTEQIAAARAAGDWDLHAALWERRRIADVTTDESALATTTATAPAVWAAYLTDGIIGDLTDEDRAAADAFIDRMGRGRPVVAGVATEYLDEHDARQEYPLPCRCSTLTFWDYEPGDDMVDSAFTLGDTGLEIQVSGRTYCLNLWVPAEETMYHLSEHSTLDEAKAAAVAHLATPRWWRVVVPCHTGTELTLSVSAASLRAAVDATIDALADLGLVDGKAFDAGTIEAGEQA